MDAHTERDNAIRLLDGLENGTVSVADATMLAEELDPVFVYAITTFLRRVYPATEPAAHSVLERLVKTTTGSRVLVRKHKEGEDDPVTRWFESEYGYGEFRGRGKKMIELLAEKLDS